MGCLCLLRKLEDRGHPEALRRMDLKRRTNSNKDCASLSDNAAEITKR